MEFNSALHNPLLHTLPKHNLHAHGICWFQCYTCLISSANFYILLSFIQRFCFFWHSISLHPWPLFHLFCTLLTFLNPPLYLALPLLCLHTISSIFYFLITSISLNILDINSKRYRPYLILPLFLCKFHTINTSESNSLQILVKLYISSSPTISDMLLFCMR